MTKIAIIDDVPMNVALVKALVMQLPDIEPACFTNPLLALAWCLAHDPDLVIVDYMMPEMSGADFVSRFRSRYPNTPVLMVTANHEMAVRYKVLELGATDFLNKPINSTELLARARNMLALRHSHQRLVEEVRLATARITAQERETIFCLAKAVECRDPETGSHILRMAHYSQQIARMLGYSADDQDMLLRAAPMHDVGKVGIPDHILLKPGMLTPEEYEIMKTHAQVGYNILHLNSSPILQLAAEIARTHHERYDGSGYPRGLAGEDIQIWGRIVAVADVFDALTADRPYRQAWGVERAADFVRNGSGTRFDPACVEAFFADFAEILDIRARFRDEDSPDARIPA
ncbi:HD domain-containing phosphohydrolase [Candidatus Symbiobacter mobilis]|uniref:Response regulator-like protein n=1 Tax=Candidatus Symbiobacter mobilis CR TaxID=946483 RepID=U5NCD7_9BURK|nr:HD domain-containing phosphohydrolase [Candidatus Symbiobacter mobilis]AGX87878.1 response regulator-like protein [Candidatus Symbiobacter mobilis CR]